MFKRIILCFAFLLFFSAPAKADIIQDLYALGESIFTEIVTIEGSPSTISPIDDYMLYEKGEAHGYNNVSIPLFGSYDILFTDFVVFLYAESFVASANLPTPPVPGQMLYLSSVSSNTVILYGKGDELIDGEEFYSLQGKGGIIVCWDVVNDQWDIIAEHKNIQLTNTNGNKLLDPTLEYITVDTATIMLEVSPNLSQPHTIKAVGGASELDTNGKDLDGVCYGVMCNVKSTGTSDTLGSDTILIDSTADFVITDGVIIGDWLFNDTTGKWSQITNVTATIITVGTAMSPVNNVGHEYRVSSASAVFDLADDETIYIIYNANGWQIISYLEQETRTFIDHTDSPYTVLPADKNVFIDTTTSDVIVLLPAVGTAKPKLRLINTGPTGKLAKVTPYGTELLFGVNLVADLAKGLPMDLTDNKVDGRW